MITERKCQWADHVCRKTDGGWTKLVLKWTLRIWPLNSVLQCGLRLTIARQRNESII